MTPIEALKMYFNFEAFRDGQEEVINKTLKGEHTLLVMPTGSGKSLTYQLPALLLPHLTLVISPLIALMKDQVDNLVEAGIAATYLNSMLPQQELNMRTRAVLEGDVKLLYIAPERLRNRQFTSALARTKVSLLAVDEAHCLSQWGHDFRPDYLQIGPTWEALGKPTLLATTATATSKVRQDIIKLLNIPQMHTIVTGFNRPNLTFRVNYVPDTTTRQNNLIASLKNLQGSAIIYAATRRKTEEVAAFIRQSLGIAAQEYHGGLDRQIRYKTQTDFMKDRLKVVVATNAFGMGVDKADVRLVLHYNLPSTLEAYYQEAGRAGRDGFPAECVLFYSPKDQGLQEWMISRDTPSYQDLQQLYTLLKHAVDNDTVHASLFELQDSSGLDHVKLRVTLSELEQAGALYHLGQQSGYYRWKVLPFSEEKLHVCLQAIQSRAQIRYQLLEQMVGYAHLNTCRRKAILDYFGDTTPPKSPRCCDNHDTTQIGDLPKAITAQEWYPLIVLETVRSLDAKIGRNTIAKILAGSEAQRIKQFNYHHHKFYGKLGHLTRNPILGLIDSLIAKGYLYLPLVDGLQNKYTAVGITPLGLNALQARVALSFSQETLVAPSKKTAEKRKKNRSETIAITLDMFKAGLSVEEIASERELAVSTIHTHLAKLIGSGKVDLQAVISASVERQIAVAIQEIGYTQALSPIKDILPETITYGEIRCVIAAYDKGEERQSAPEISDVSNQEFSQELNQEETTKQTNEEENNHQVTQIIPTSDKTSTSVTAQPEAQVIILESVAKLGGIMGRTGLAKFLTGSQAKWLESFTTHSHYGKLNNLSQKAVLGIIDVLLAENELQSTGGRRPKVVLSNNISEQSDQDQNGDKQDITGKTSKDEAKGINTAKQSEKQAVSEKGNPGIEGLREAIEKVQSTSTQSDKPSATNTVTELVVSKNSPAYYILEVVQDLEGLLTVQALSKLLTVSTGEVVPFGDHQLTGQLNGGFSSTEVERIIEEMIGDKQLALTHYGKLALSD